MWLRALKLSSYIETFAKNEISGSVLLDLGQSDLDYMQIHALGHRKVIMREIERLKRGKSSVDLFHTAFEIIPDAPWPNTFCKTKLEYS